MSEKRAIVVACALGFFVLGVLLLIAKPFSRFEKEYPMKVASGPAAGEKPAPVQTVRPQATEPSEDSPDPTEEPEEKENTSKTGIPLVRPEGKTLEDRVDVPDGFARTEEPEGSLGAYLRNQNLKKDGAPVRLYNKEKKSVQTDHIAVFKFPLSNEDLQQCADSVMRVYAEYFRATGQEDRISFSLSQDFKASYVRWREGYRIHENGNSYTMVDEAAYDDSNEGFEAFLRIVFAYAGTYSLEMDSKKVKEKDLRIGDCFLHAGSPGHVVMVVDTCANVDGRKGFLLAQGYMPAQQFHILKNPAHEDDPWYYVDEISYPFKTPEYTFEKSCLRRPGY